MKIFLALACLVPLIALTGCDCPEFNTQAYADPNVRWAEITEFNPRWEVTPPDTLARAVPAFSVQTFAFPTDQNSAGDQVIDSRFREGKKAVIKEAVFTDNNNEYTAQLVADIPTNSNMMGDIMLLSVDLSTSPKRAKIRIKGSFARYSDRLNSASVSEFTDYLRKDIHKVESERLAASAVKYGTAAASGRASTRVLNAAGKDTAVTIPAAILEEFDKNAGADYYDIEIELGEVFFYRAANGVEYAVHVEDIFSGSFDPKFKSIKIQFAELKGPSCK